MQKRVDELKQRRWDEMSDEEKNYQKIIYDRCSPDEEKNKISHKDSGNLFVVGFILAIVVFVIFFGG